MGCQRKDRTQLVPPKQPMPNKTEAEKQNAKKNHTAQQVSKSSLRVAVPETGNENCTSTVLPQLLHGKQLASAPLSHSGDGLQLQRHKRLKGKRLIRSTGEIR